MSSLKPSAKMQETKARAVGRTEHSWCYAVPDGTGIAVLAILTSKFPETSCLENALHKLQICHPILRSRLLCNQSSNAFSFITSPSPFVKVKSFNLSSTLSILENPSNGPKDHPTVSVSPFHLILEHELNQNAWSNPVSSRGNPRDLFLASTYELPNTKRMVVLRLHVSACDRTAAESLLKELLALAGREEVQMEAGNKGEVSLAVEDLIPAGKAKKSLWTRGVDMLGYSVNSLRLTNLKFKDTKSPRSSQVVRLQLNQNDTERILSGCRSRGIKLCGALEAAGLIAAHQSHKSNHAEKHRKYGVVTLIDCRSILEPALSSHHFGFYHSAILNTHVMKGREKLWDLAIGVYTAFDDYKKSNRHFSDMADLNFLMCKAVENPGLTSSSSLRTSLISVFEDTVIDNSDDAKQKEAVGLEDYMGCASVHGIGPSIAMFDTIRDGKLDCLCVYPSPLHSREQMEEFVGNMKRILVDSQVYEN